MNWRYQNWGEVEGWACSKHFKPRSYEFVPQEVKDQRNKYAKSLLQPFRQGKLSKEWAKAYPKKTKKMVKDGTITQQEVDKAKPVWTDLKSSKNLDKSL